MSSFLIYVYVVTNYTHKIICYASVICKDIFNKTRSVNHFSCLRIDKKKIAVCIYNVNSIDAYIQNKKCRAT